MESFFQISLQEILNLIILAGLGVYSFKMTKKVEYLKGQLDVSTSNDKWLINKQSRALIDLSEKIFSIQNNFSKFPKYNEIGYNISTDFSSEFSIQTLGLGYLSIFIDDKKMFSILDSYLKKLFEINKKKNEIIKILETKFIQAQDISVDEKNEMEQSGSAGSYCIQPDAYKDLNKEYYDFLFENLYDKEYHELIKYIRNWLRSSDRLNKLSKN